MENVSLSPQARAQLVLRGGLAPLVSFVLLFGLAGRFDYWQAWVYLATSVALVLIMTLALTPHRELLEERLNPKEGVKSWDKLYFALSTPLFFVSMALGGLDARFRWSADLPLPIYWVGVMIYVLGQGILLWARYTNRFFSSMVRIQTDRGQTVCRAGPYQYVRHPGYVGGILLTLSMGVLLGSWLACIPQLLAASLLVWRTALEDQTLRKELPGYAEYAGQTKYRLLPGVW